MEHVFTLRAADVTADSKASVVSLASHRVNRSKTSHMEPEAPKVGTSYRSRRTNRNLLVTAIEDDRVYYRVDGYDTQSPLFLPTEKFMHLVGLDRKSE
ncbi:MAG: hypothetical protein KL863_29155 [Rhizobium sp.]|jgi:hypothetical protein|nr:hypothetical protein [Rhizobium sp.]